MNVEVRVNSRAIQISHIVNNEHNHEHDHEHNNYMVEVSESNHHAFVIPDFDLEMHVNREGILFTQREVDNDMDMDMDSEDEDVDEENVNVDDQYQQPVGAN